jgi:DNA-binding CsgD family transcriptional regulator
LKGLANIEQLTERERKILELMGMGMTDTRIAMEFHITQQRLASFIGNIEQKTGLHTRTELEQLGRSINDADQRLN